MDFTGERYIPDLDGQIKYEHLHRYAVCLELVVGKSVLDIASGEGYGSALLARVAQSVVGVDILPQVVDYAAKEYSSYENLQFMVGSCDAIPLPNQSVDIVTSFETIEHHNQHTKMMQEVKRVLKPGGFLVISSPNRLTYSDEPNYSNPFHVKELYYDELVNLLNCHFSHVKIYGQRLSIGSFIFPLENVLENSFKAYTGSSNYLKQQVSHLNSPLYFVAICSNRVDDIQRTSLDSVYIDEADDLWLQNNRRISQIETEIGRSQSHLQQTQLELERSLLELQKTQLELERSQLELQQANKNSVYYQNVIQAMESSKFWKLRKMWFKMKSSNSNTVTIVVPIFNAYEDIMKCLDSLLLYTDYRHKILLIDDASTDKRIAELTQKLSSQYAHITCITNSKNLGFVKNCNIGFSKSEQTEDVVLLNSDTIVTPNWLEKLILAAYSSRDVATVTPLTNNGTICSVPNWLEENQIPEGYDIASFGRFIENISLRKYPMVPTAVGFCMYIKRKILNKVGYFDEINFGKGYGEENDFCCRASDAGYAHIIDDSTFIYHAGSKSFGEEKQKLIQNNSAILSKLHPNYFPEVHKFITDKSIQNIISNIGLHLYIDRIKKLSPICFILHNSTENSVNAPLGGTEYHCAALIAELRQIYPIYTLYFDKHKSFISLNIFFKEDSINFAFPCQLPNTNSYLVENTSFLNMFTDILRHFQPTIIHIHHLINLPILDISVVLKQEKIPYLVSIHDYYFICPSYNLIDYQQQFCFEYKNEQYCQQCIQSLFSEGKDLKQKWSHISEKILQEAELIIAPSATSASYLTREYRSISDKVKVIRHGIFTQEFIENQTHNRVNFSKKRISNWSIAPLKIGFIGSINVSKGAKLISELIERVNNQSKFKNNFEFHFFGSFSGEIPAKSTNVKLNSPYKHQDLQNILDNIDIVIFPNIWAETYCLTADEVLFFGVPIISSPIGAVAERIKEFGVGWISSSCSTDDLINILLSLKNNYEDYEKVKINIDKYNFVSYKEMSNNYLQEYNRIINNNPDVNQNMSPKSTLFLTPQDIFSGYNQGLQNKNNLQELRVPLSKRSAFFRFLKNNFFWIWNLFKLLAIKFKLIK